MSEQCTLIRQVIMQNEKQQNSGKRLVFQSLIDAERMEKLRKIAEHKGVSMSGQFRMWIDAAYARLPECKR